MDGTYSPWRDDVFLAEESSFALLSKAAWFNATPPVEYLFALQPLDVRRKQPPKVVRLHAPTWWLPFVVGAVAAPVVAGQSLAEAFTERQDSEDPSWQAFELRHCQTCLRDGIHLRVHQHRAVLHCPVHGQPLTTRCGHCHAELFHVVHRGVPAYTCPSCRRGWLRRELDPFRYDDAFRARVTRSSTRVVGLLTQVLPPGHVNCGIANRELTEAELEVPWSGHLLWLGARARTLDRPPRWMRVPALPTGVEVTAVSSPLRTGPGSDPARTAPCTEPASKVARMGKDRLLSALRRVAAVGVRQCGPQHSTCLELPYRLFGQTYTGPHDDYADLMSCCPVALGFWLWRQAAAGLVEHSDLENYLHAPVRADDLDRLCYLNAKSHLHYCIACAAECLRLGQQDRQSSWAEMLLVLARSEWNPLAWEVRIGKERGWWFDRGDRAEVLRFRAYGLIAQLPCPGVQTYAAFWARLVSLMRRSRRQTLLGPDEATPADIWFRRLSAPANRSTSELSHFAPRSARPDFCHTRVGIPVPGFRTVDAAVNARAPASIGHGRAHGPATS